MQPSTVVSMCQALRSWRIKHGSQEGSILTSLEAAGLVSFPGVSKPLCFPLLCDWALREFDPFLQAFTGVCNALEGTGRGNYQPMSGPGEGEGEGSVASEIWSHLRFLAES